MIFKFDEDGYYDDDPPPPPVEAKPLSWFYRWFGWLVGTPVEAHPPSHLPARDPSKQMWVIGQKYLIRTATHYWTGRLIDVGPQEIVIDKASWIPQTGKWSHALCTGELEDTESVPGDVIINRYGVIDATMWLHPLPKGPRKKKPQ